MTAAHERLKQFASRVNRLMDDRDGITGDIRDVFTEVKSAGFNGPAFRKVIAAMRMDPEKRKTLEFDIDLYRIAVGLDEGASLDDQPRVVAAKMLADGAGVRATARATGVKKSTVADMSGKIVATKNPDTQSEAGASTRKGDVQPVAVPLTAPASEPIAESTCGSTLSPQAGNDVPQSSGRASPPVEPIETDRAADVSAPQPRGDRLITVMTVMPQGVSSPTADNPIPDFLRRVQAPMPKEERR